MVTGMASKSVVRRAAPSAPPFERQGIHVMAKPIGPICNLDCAYCYYLHKEELYPGTTSWRMPEHTLETYIRQYIEAQPPGVEEITFAWQGGEPTLLGVEFFRRAVAFQKQFAPRGTKVVNSLQTNGTLLDEEWMTLFKEHHFLIGLSIDGPADLHDRYRFDKHGAGTFVAVRHALQLLQRAGVEFNALVVVNRHNGDHGKRVYTYLRDSGVKFLQFIPIVERRGVGAHGERLVPLEIPSPAEKSDLSLDIGHLTLGIEDSASMTNAQCEMTDDKSLPPRSPSPADLVSSRSVLPDQFGTFLIKIFDEWVRRDVGKVFVQIFDQALSAWLGIEPSLCVFRRQCGRALALEHNGDLYSCDHFVEPEWLLGNIHHTPLAELAASDRQRAFGEAKESTLPRYCRECEVRFACNGECPKNRFLTTPDGEPGLNYLCAGYRRFFNHVDPYMRLMAEELKAGRPAANVMTQFKRHASQRGTNVGDPSALAIGRRPARTPKFRNELCPCGSGRKYKRCCGTG
jgi:uncharacterized protein